MPGLLDIILGYDCNLACDYCTITPSMRARSLATPQVLEALREGRLEGYDSLSITGGEPTIRPDLLGIVRAGRSLGYRAIELKSNGLLYAVPANVTRLAEAGVSHFHISIHTHDAEHYDALVRRRGSYESMCRGLDVVVAQGLALVVHVILKADTYERLVPAMVWLHARGVRQVDLWYVSLTDGNASKPDSMPPMTEVVPTMAKAFAFAREHGMRLRSLHVPRCLLGGDHPHAHDPAAGRVKVVTPDASFELAQSRLTGQIFVPACSGCEFEGRCPGVRADYLERYGDAEIAAARGQEPTRRGSATRSLPLALS